VGRVTNRKTNDFEEESADMVFTQPTLYERSQGVFE
jgi:hypothetical protein